MKAKYSSRRLAEWSRYLLAAVILLVGTPPWAQEVAELQSEVDAKQAELESMQATLASQEQAAIQQDADLERLVAREPELEQGRAQALDAMKAQYERIVADPSLDFSTRSRRIDRPSSHSSATWKPSPPSSGRSRSNEARSPPPGRRWPAARRDSRGYAKAMMRPG